MGGGRCPDWQWQMRDQKSLRKRSDESKQALKSEFKVKWEVEEGRKDEEQEEWDRGIYTLAGCEENCTSRA